jgi:hypothetical protein
MFVPALGVVGIRPDLTGTLCFAHRTASCKRVAGSGANAEKHGKAAFFAFWPQLRRNQSMNILTKLSG